MKRYLLILSAALFFVAGYVAHGAELSVAWTNAPENPPGTQTVVSWGGASGVYTNQVTVAAGVSTVTITNLPAGRRIYVAARAFDGVDYSIYSNEDNGKTKLNAPKTLNVTP